jgi:hypothetical protein
MHRLNAMRLPLTSFDRNALLLSLGGVCTLLSFSHLIRLPMQSGLTPKKHFSSRISLTPSKLPDNQYPTFSFDKANDVRY